MFLRKYLELPKNFFGLLFWNIMTAVTVVFFLMGLLALFGVRPVEFNGEPTYGVMGLIASMVMAPIMALVSAFTTWLFAVAGNFILRLVIKREKIQ